MYRKEIIYMGLFQNDIREGSAGYFKAEKKDNAYRLELQVKNIPGAVTGSFPVRLQSKTGWREADALVMKNGSGKWNGSMTEEVWRVEIPLSNFMKIKGESRYFPTTELPGGEPSPDRRENADMRTGQSPDRSENVDRAEQLSGRQGNADVRSGQLPDRPKNADMHIGQSSDRWENADMRTGQSSDRWENTDVRTEQLSDRWENADVRTGQLLDRRENTDMRAGQLSDRQEKAAAWADGRKIKREEAQTRSPEISLYPEREGTAGSSSETGPVMRAEALRMPQQNRPAWKKAERGGGRSGQREEKTEHVPLYENKWEQLLTTYEQIHPYGDNRIYVKLEPKDFIVLRENYQHLVNNSFLLHGFYNYRYLILGKEKDFYLGVPGVFYEREKMVALMFGFEAFECEGSEAEEGKFGYYLRKVEL